MKATEGLRWIGAGSHIAHMLVWSCVACLGQMFMAAEIATTLGIITDHGPTDPLACRSVS